MKPTYFVYLSLMLVVGCASTKNRRLHKQIDRTLHSSTFENQFTGLLVINADTKDTLYDRNSHKYFTPASNTKIVTLYTALKLLPNRLPALKYRFVGDTLFIQGTGDPTLLHPYFKDSTAVHFVRDYDYISLNLNNFNTGRFGPGWAWDDYQYGYQVEKSAFPMYGNIIRIFNKDSLQVTPDYFKDSVIELNYQNNRMEDRNLFFYGSNRTDTLHIPFRTDTSLTRKLLEQATGKRIQIAKTFPAGKKDTLPGMVSDSIYKRMMVESDNFLAEQLLLLASSTLSDTLNGAKAQQYMLKSKLSSLQQRPRWVDGSGLSRYNLFSPQSLVHILYNMYQEQPRERLFNLFPVGGVSGTLGDWYAGESSPYIFAKSGSLGNNYCLSGYLRTQSGKTLIFSFMNNHFMHPSKKVKKEMEALLKEIRDTY